MAKLTRREFIDISKTAIIAGSVGLPAVNMFCDTNLQAASKGESEKVIPSYCDVCFMTCGINVTVKNGKAIKIEGNPHHPISRGKLCPRGTGGLGQLYDPDRLKTPLIRTTQSGSQSFKSVSWDEAFQYIAKKMNRIRRNYGPEALALLKHCKGSAPFVELWHAMGSKTEGHASYAQCRGARDLGFKLTFGGNPGGIERIGLDKAKVVAFIGAHLGENMHNVTVQDYTTGLRNGAQNIVVDPRFSTTASKAKYWLPIKPGTDIALLLAWIHVLINENLYDKDYVQNNTIGFEQLAEHVKDKTPEWAAEQTSLTAKEIRATAVELGKAIPHALLFPGRRYAWYGNDTQRARAVAIVNALLGAWGNESGFYLGDKFKIPKYPIDVKHHGKGKAAFNYKDKYPLGTSTPLQDIIRASIPGNYDKEKSEALIRGWVVYSTNLMTSVPDPQLIRKAIEHLDLLVVVDTLPSEITGFADVILPDTTYLERHDVLNSPPWKEPFVSIRQPAVEPLHDSKPSWWIAQQLANYLYLEEFFPYNHYKDVIEYQLNQLGSSIEDINANHGVLKKPYAEPELKFKTPSKKIELYSQRLADLGHDPMPEHHKQKLPPESYFRLLYGRAPQHTFTKTTNNPMLLELYPENEVWVNVATGEEFNLKDKEYVMLENQDGVRSNDIRVRLTKRIRKDCVFLVHGFGRSDRRLKKGFAKGADDNSLLTDYVTDPIMGSTGSQVNFVTFVKRG